MPRREGQPRHMIGSRCDPCGFPQTLGYYRLWMRSRCYPERMMERFDLYISDFIQWCAGEGIARPIEVSRPVMERYARFLFDNRGPFDAVLPPCSRLVPVSDFFVWLSLCIKAITYNPVIEPISCKAIARTGA